MSREFKQTFFTILLAVLLILSNFLCLKLTNFGSLTITCDFLTYPFTFLCTLLIMNIGGKKSAYRAIIATVLVKLFTTISLALAVKLGTSVEVPSLAEAVNQIFKINELALIASIVSFIVSHSVLIYIYDNFKRSGKELYGIVIGLLGSLVLNTLIFKVITLHDYEPMFIINSLLSNIIVSVIMIIIITILYYILKEKEVETVAINNMNIDVNKYSTSDMSIEDVMLDRKNDKLITSEKEKKPVNKKKTTNSKKTSSKKTTTNKNSKNTTNKSKKTSKPKVNKKDN